MAAAISYLCARVLGPYIVAPSDVSLDVRTCIDLEIRDEFIPQRKPACAHPSTKNGTNRP